MLLLVNQLASNQIAPAARVCGLCTSVDHFIDSCLALQQQAAASSSTLLDTPQAYAANIFNNNRPQHQQQNHDLSTNIYNPRWSNHPNLRWGNQGKKQQQNQQFQNVQPPPQQTCTCTSCSDSTCTHTSSYCSTYTFFFYFIGGFGQDDDPSKHEILVGD